MHYAVMSHVTDYDVWHEEPVSAAMVFKQFHANITLAQQGVALAVDKIGASLAAQHGHKCGCDSALAAALSTHRDQINPETLRRLEPIVGKYLGGQA
jgi:5'-methylthioadenosine phosphorylase